MRQVIVGAMVSVDGVMQAPGGPTEDPTKGFKFGGWVMPYFDRESREEIDRLCGEKFDLLLGRKTYETFAAYWPYYDEGGPDGGIAKLFKRIRKYVVSRSGDVDTSWAGSELLRDIAGVKRLRQGDGPNLVTQGSTELVHALLADGSAPHAYKLTGSRVSGTGVMIASYERDGEIKIDDTGPENPSQAEVARRARMKREG